MDYNFIHRQNVERYRELLKTVSDDSQRNVILQLLAEEEAKLAQHAQEQKKS